MPFAPAFDRRDSIYYECHGSGPHKIFFLMGILTPGDDWEIQTDFFSRQGGEFTCCTIDNRGTGHSSTPRGLLTTHDMALDAASVLTHLEWTKDVHVVAISMGGMIALELAAEFPHMLRSLSLIATHAGGPLGIAPVIGMARFVSTLAPQEDEEAVRILMSILYSPTALNDPATYKPLFEHHLRKRRERGQPRLPSSVAQMAAVVRHNVSQERLLRLRHSGIAIQVIVGTHDLLVRTQNSHYLADTLSCPLHVLQGGGHVLTRERPAELNKLLLDHVRVAAASAWGKADGPGGAESERSTASGAARAAAAGDKASLPLAVTLPSPTSDGAHPTHPEHAASFHDASKRTRLASGTPLAVRRALELAPKQRPSTVLHCVEGAAAAAAGTLLALRVVEPLLPRSRLARWLRTRANALVAVVAAAVALSRAVSAGRASFAAWRHAHRHGVLDALPGMNPPFSAAAVALVSVAILRAAARRAL